MTNKICIVGDSVLEENCPYCLHIDMTQAVAELFETLNEHVCREGGSIRMEPDRARRVGQLGKQLNLSGWEALFEAANNIIHSRESHTFQKHLESQVPHFPQGHFFVGERCELPRCDVLHDTPVAELHQDLLQKIKGERPHQHQYSTIGRCMYQNCEVRKEEDDVLDKPGDN